jgi:hypothetical protein
MDWNLMLASAGLTTATASISKATKTKQGETRQLPEIVPPTNVPDVPNIIKDIKTPEQSIDEFKPIEEILPPSTTPKLPEKVKEILKPIISKPVDEIISKLKDEHKALFPEFDRLKTGNLSFIKVKKGNILPSVGFDISAAKRRVNTIDSFIQINLSKINTAKRDGMAPAIPNEYIELGDEISEIIESNVPKAELFRESQITSGWPQVVRIGRWLEVYNFAINEKSKMKHNFSDKYIKYLSEKEIAHTTFMNTFKLNFKEAKAIYDEWAKNNPPVLGDDRFFSAYVSWSKASDAIRAKRPQYKTYALWKEMYDEWLENHPAPFRHSKDYTKKKFDYLNIVIDLMRVYEQSLFTPWRSESGTYDQSNVNISRSKSHFNHKFSEFKEMLTAYAGRISLDDYVSELELEIQNQEKGIERARGIIDYYNSLYETFDEKRYLKYLYSKFNPDSNKEIEDEIENLIELCWSNEKRLKSEKKWLTSELQDLQSKSGLTKIEYALTRAFYETQIQLLNKLKDHVNKYKYTEVGEFKRSKLLKLGYEGYKEVPTTFLQWANLKFVKTMMGTSVIALSEMYQELIGLDDPIRQYEFYKKVKPALESFDREYKRVKATLVPSHKLNYMMSDVDTSTVKLAYDKIKQIEKISQSTVWALLEKYIPDSYYAYSLKTRGYLPAWGLKIPDETVKKMREILSKKEKEFLKVYPDSGLNFQMIRNRAYYLKDIAPLSKEIVTYFDDRIKHLRQQSIETIELLLELPADSIGREKLENKIAGIDLRINYTREMMLKSVALPFIEQVERFYYKEDEIKTDKQDQAQYIERVKATIKHHKYEIENAATMPEDKVRYEEELPFYENQVLPYLENALAAKNKVYEFIIGKGIEMVREKQLFQAKTLFDAQLKAGKYPFPMGSYTFPRSSNALFFPKVDFSQTLTEADLLYYINKEDNPVGKSDSKFLLMGFNGFPATTEVYLDLYIKVGRKLALVYDQLRRKQIQNYPSDKEFAFYNLLYLNLLKNVYVDYDIRALVPFVHTGTIGKMINNNVVETPIINIKKKIQRMEAYKQQSNFNSNFLFDTIIKKRGAKNIKDSDFTDNTIFTDQERELITYSYITPPDLRYVMKYAEVNNLLPVEAVRELDVIWNAYTKYLMRKFINNPEWNHNFYNQFTPKSAEISRKWNTLKFQIIDKQENTVNEIFKDFVSYLDHWDKHENDQEWSGKYSWLFKSNSDRNRLAGLGDDFSELSPLDHEQEHVDETMGGWLSDAFNFMTDAAKKAAEKARAAAVRVGDNIGRPLEKFPSPITGSYKEMLSLTEKKALEAKLKGAWDDIERGKIIDRLKNAMSELEVTVMRPIGKAIKKTTYAIIPKSWFQALKRFSKIPGHLISNKGKLSKKDIRQAMRDALQIYMVAAGGGIVAMHTNKIMGKQLQVGIKNIHVLNKLDLYSGGLLTSGSNLMQVQKDIAAGKKVDRTYILMRAVDYVKVAGAVAAGPIMVAATTGGEFLIQETELGESSIGRGIVRTTVTAAAIYSSGGSDIASKEGQRAGMKEGAKITAKQAINVAAQREAKATAFRELEKNAIRHTVIGKSEIGKTALHLGIGATADAIYNDNSVSKAVQDAAVKEATAVSKARADRQLQKIDKNLTVDNLASVYKLKDKDLAQIMKDGRQKFEDDVKNGRLTEKAKLEADRYVKREINKKFQDELGKYSKEFLDYLMWKYGPKWNYDYDITPQDYILYQDWYYYYQQQAQPRVFQYQYIISKAKKRTAILIGSGALAAGVLAWMALED